MENNIKKKLKNKKLPIKCIFFIIFFAIFLLKSSEFYNINICLDKQIIEYKEKIQKQKEEYNLCVKQKEYYSSDDYVEKVARDQLGLVKSDETIYVDTNK